MNKKANLAKVGKYGRECIRIHVACVRRSTGTIIRTNTYTNHLWPAYNYTIIFNYWPPIYRPFIYVIVDTMYESLPYLAWGFDLAKEYLTCSLAPRI